LYTPGIYLQLGTAIMSMAAVHKTKSPRLLIVVQKKLTKLLYSKKEGYWDVICLLDISLPYACPCQLPSLI